MEYVLIIPNLKCLKLEVFEFEFFFPDFGVICIYMMKYLEDGTYI